MEPQLLQVELHRHLDVSLRPSTALRLAQEKGLEAQSTSLQTFCQKLILRQPMNDLAAVLNTFSLFQKILDRPEVLEQVAFEVVEDCWTEGTHQVELRFSPGFITEFNHLPWNDLLDGLERGIQKAQLLYPKMKVGLICIASRNLGPASAEQTVEFYLKNKTRLVGLDLAGDEAHYPTDSFQAAFQCAHQNGAKITIHAGEADGPESVWKAIEDLGAQRIGHGIRSIEDPSLVEYLVRNQICLEVCPTSNWLTHVVPALCLHPLPQLLRAGVPVCINTDDPAVFGVTLPHEVAICSREMGLTQAEIAKTFEYALTHSFLEHR